MARDCQRKLVSLAEPEVQLMYQMVQFSAATQGSTALDLDDWFHFLDFQFQPLSYAPPPQIA
jgi:hypothetical protein